MQNVKAWIEKIKLKFTLFLRKHYGKSVVVFDPLTFVPDFYKNKKNPGLQFQIQAMGKNGKNYGHRKKNYNLKYENTFFIKYISDTK